MRRLAVTVLIALSYVWFGACRSCMAQQIIGRPMLPLNSADPCVTCTQNLSANTATFAGGVDMVYTNTAIAGIADSKTLTIAVWLKRTSAGGTIFEIDANTSLRFRLAVNGSSQITLNGFNSSAATILQANTASTINTSWHHIYCCVDLSDATKRHIYIDGVDQSVTWTTYSNDTMDLVPTTPQRAMANNFSTQGTGYNGAMAEFWFSSSYINSPCLLYCSGHPAVVSSTGQLSDGSNPAIYLSKVGGGPNWKADSSGNGNTFSNQIGTQGTTTSP